MSKGMVINKEFENAVNENAVKEMELQHEMKINFKEGVASQMCRMLQGGFTFAVENVYLSSDCKSNRLRGYCTALLCGCFIDGVEFDRLFELCERV